MNRSNQPLGSSEIMNVVMKARQLSLQMAQLGTCTDKELDDLVDHFAQRILAMRRDITRVRDEQLRRAGFDDDREEELPS